MRNTADDYRRLINQMALDGVAPTASATARRVGVTPVTARRMAKKAGVAVISEASLIRLSYYCSVINCRNADKQHGIVTIEQIALERKVSIRTVESFFKIHRDLMREWGVLTKREAKAQRCRIVASRLRAKYPGCKIYAKQIAIELGYPEQSFYAYLGHRPDLVRELGITYTSRRRRGG